MPYATAFSSGGLQPPHNDSTTTPVHSSVASCPPAEEQLLTLDLNVFRTNPEKLMLVCKDLQELGKRKCEEVKKLQLQSSSDLGRTHSRSSRRATDDSDFSKSTIESEKSEMERKNRKGTRVVYSPLDSTLTVLQSRAMKDHDYIRTKLPSFHPWTDTLHIYDEGSPRPRYYVTKSLEPSSASTKDIRLIRTIKLGQLGMRVTLRRIFGQLDEIYIHSPQS